MLGRTRADKRRNRSKRFLMQDFEEMQKGGLADASSQRSAESASIAQTQGRLGRMSAAGAAPQDSGSSLYGDKGSLKKNLITASADDQLRLRNQIDAENAGGSGGSGWLGGSGGSEAWPTATPVKPGPPAPYRPNTGRDRQEEGDSSPFNRLPPPAGSSFVGGEYGRIVQDGRGGYKPYVNNTADKIMHRTPRLAQGVRRLA